MANEVIMQFEFAGKFAVIAPSLFLGFSAEAELPSLIPREMLFGNPKRAELQISPDGGQLAWLAPDKNGVAQRLGGFD